MANGGNTYFHSSSPWNYFPPCYWKILFLVAVDGIISQAKKTSLVEKNMREKSQVELSGVPVVEKLGSRTGHQPAYLFSTFVSDPSRNFLQSRSEVRGHDGEVRGEYSYMDGHYKMRLLYKAGNGGFHVLRQERTALKMPSEQKKDNLIQKSRRRRRVLYYFS